MFRPTLKRVDALPCQLRAKEKICRRLLTLFAQQRRLLGRGPVIAAMRILLGGFMGKHTLADNVGVTATEGV